MNNKKIIFYCQNVNQAQNLVEIYNELNKKNFEVKFIVADDLYKQNVEQFIKNKTINYEVINLENETSFYLTGSLKRIKILLKIKNQIQTIADTNDKVILGCDGAVERLIIYEFNKRNKKSYLIIDGMISNYDFSFIDIFRYSNNFYKDFKDYISKKTKHIILRLYKYIKKDYLLPSEVGHSKCTEICVMGKYTKDVLVEQGVKEQKIHVTGSPKYENIISDYKVINGGNINVVYLTGAFKWHGAITQHDNQIRDIDEICKSINTIKGINMTIKIHPRDDMNDYKDIANKYNTITFCKDVNYNELINNSDVVISAISTGLMECLMINKIPIIYMGNFDTFRYKNSFIKFDEWIKCYDINELINALDNIKNNEKYRSFKLDSMKKLLFNFIYYDTKNATKNIIQIIEGV